MRNHWNFSLIESKTLLLRHGSLARGNTAYMTSSSKSMTKYLVILWRFQFSARHWFKNKIMYWEDPRLCIID